MGFGSNSSEVCVPDAQFSECGFVCDPIQSQTPIICRFSSRPQSVSGRCSVHGLEISSCICVSSFYSDPCCSRENSTTSVQNSSASSILATTTAVLRTSPSVGPDLSATNSKTLDSVQRFVHQNLPVLNLHTWELSINQSEIKNFAKHCRVCLQIKKNIYSKNLQCEVVHLHYLVSYTKG